MGDYDPRYLQGIEYFNRGAYFSSHEVWEDLWRDDLGEAHTFYKGLIQAAVALHHLGHGNRHGARKLLGTSRQCLAAYGPTYLGLDVERFVAEVASLCEGGVCTPRAGGLPVPPRIVLEAGGRPAPADAQAADRTATAAPNDEEAAKTPGGLSGKSARRSPG